MIYYGHIISMPIDPNVLAALYNNFGVLPTYKPVIEMIMYEKQFSLVVNDSGTIYISYNANGEMKELTRKHCITRTKYLLIYGLHFAFLYRDMVKTDDHSDDSSSSDSSSSTSKPENDELPELNTIQGQIEKDGSNSSVEHDDGSDSE
jgi:hypothetical protein